MTYQIFKAVNASVISSSFALSAMAAPQDFHNGSVIAEFGKVASIDADMKIPKRAKFKVAFDTVKAAKPGELNKTLNAAARFLNMHGEAGVAEKNMKLAIVFHGGASIELTNHARYGEKHNGAENANAALIKALTDKGVRVILCGQSAAYHRITKDSLLPSVEIALSAMTAHALLQQSGYTINPF